MPRPRFDLPGVPQHVYQRGVNRGDCFFNEVDRRFYLNCLRDAAAKRGCEIHAYVLMTNHVHLLVTSSERGAIGAMMQDVGRRYVRTINTLHRRTGTLWEARFKSSLIDSESYLLTCHRYIELNPVRAGLAAAPSSYPWSSFAYYAGTAVNTLITEHSVYRTLGASPAERRMAYCELVAQGLDDRTLARIRESLHTNSALGSDTFLKQLEAKLGKSVRPPLRGRPPKDEATKTTIDGVTGNLF